MNLTLPRIALTAGEPAGIGADLCVQLAQQLLPACELVVLADPELLLQRAKELNLPLKLHHFDPSNPKPFLPAGNLVVFPVELKVPVQSGVLNPENSEYVLELLNQATHGCLNGTFSAMVTAPVHKGVINEAGFAFTGHTEYIADIINEQPMITEKVSTESSINSAGITFTDHIEYITTTRSEYPVMMLATKGLRVALATTHLPLSQVCMAITPILLERVIGILNQDLQNRFGIINPQILVCGLNPHAGEEGYLGREEIDVINPVLEQLRQKGMNLHGALPADSLFTPKHLKTADAVLAMYHDQGLPVLKYKGFGHAANITLGLSIIRTSVDHGTALNLAGTGKADCGSLQYALQTAITMSSSQKLEF